MPRRYSLSDVMDLLDKVDSWTNGVPTSVILRRCQPVVNQSVTRTACDRARDAFAARKISTYLPPRFERREAVRADFEVNEIPRLHNLMMELGSFLPFIPDLTLGAMLKAAELWARYEGGHSPKALSARCHAAAARYRAQQAPPAAPLWPFKVLAFRDGKILGSIVPPRAYACR